MQKYKNIVACVLASFITVVVLMWLSTWHAISISHVDITSETINNQVISLPYSGDINGSYIVNIDLAIARDGPQQFRIIPDDELLTLTLNGQAFPLDNISLAQRRDYSSGFVLTIDNLKPNQVNTLSFLLTNASYPAGFDFKVAQPYDYLQLFIIFMVLMLYAFYISRYLKIALLQKLLLAIAIIVSVMYLSKTDAVTRTFDVSEGGGHKDYIEYIIRNHSLPNPGEGWEYHQPPLYYLMAACVKSVGIVNVASGYQWAQLLAMFFWVVFLVSALACLQIAFRKQWLPLALGSMAMCLWPAGIIHSVRIGNDVPLYACYGLAFFYTLTWWKSRRFSALFWASLWMAIGVITKSNALAMAATLGILFVVRFFLNLRKPMFLKLQRNIVLLEFSVIAGLLLIACAINFGDNIYYYLNGSASDWLLSNVGQTVNPLLSVDNTIKNYVVFDLPTFLQNPFMSTSDDTYGRQYFWNFLWRSALSSEFSFDGQLMAIWGQVNGVLLLVMLVGTLLYFLQQHPYRSWQTFKFTVFKNLPWLLSLIFLLILLLAYRIKAPFACNTDFRYIYPALESIIFFAVVVWREPKKLRISLWLSTSLGLLSINTLVWVTAL